MLTYFYPDDFITIETAYELTVRKLAPEARPGDEYLISLSEEESDAAYARIDEAERIVEAKFRNALADRKLFAWRYVENRRYYRSIDIERAPTWKEWRRPAFGVPSVGFDAYYDHTINEFLQPSPPGDEPGNKSFLLKTKDFEAWLRRQRRRRAKSD